MNAQYQLSYAFDALIDNRGRTLDRYLYDADTAMLLLTGHGAAFGTATELPKTLVGPLAKTGAEMQSRLRRLTPQNVDAAIGDLIGSRAVKAVLQRRDRILDLAGKAAAAPAR
jgi:hypothetical protein